MSSCPAVAATALHWPISIDRMRDSSEGPTAGLSEWKFALLLAAIIAAVYWNSIFGSFIWDDRAAIVSNGDVRGFNPVQSILHHDFWGQDITAKDSHKSFRPVTTLSFRLDHIIYGLSAMGYHISNLIVYYFATMMMYSICLQWIAMHTARLAALLFILHPVHVEAVASIVGRADALCGGLYFLSMFCYTKGLRMSDSSIASFCWIVASLLAGVVSGFAKEIGVTVFAVLAVVEVLERLQLLSQRDQQMKKQHGREVKSSFMRGVSLSLSALREVFLNRSSLLRLSAIVSIVLLFFRFRYSLHGEHAIYKWTVMENHVHPIPDPLARSLSYAQTHFWYLFKLFYPRYLCFDYGFDCIPTIYSIIDWRNVLPLFAYTLVLMTIVYAIRQCRVAMLLGLATFLIALSPALNVLMPVGTLLAERLLFIPSMGFCIVIAEVLHIDCAHVWNAIDESWLLQSTSLSSSSSSSILSKKKSPSSAAAVAPLPSPSSLAPSPRRQLSSLYLFILPLLLAFSARIITRNIDWRTEINMYSSALAVCPRSIKALSNHGLFAAANRRLHDAEQRLNLAAEIYPKHVAAILNLGVTYMKEDRFVESIRCFESAIEFDELIGMKAPGYLAQTLFHFADVMTDPSLTQALKAESLLWFGESIRKGFAPPAILHVAGSAATDIGDFELAVTYFEAAILAHEQYARFRQGSSDVALEDDIRLPFTLNQLALAMSNLNRIDAALYYYTKGLELEPDNVPLLANAALLLRQQQRYHEARELTERCIRMAGNPPPPALVNNWGSLELEVGNYTAALQLFKQGLILARQQQQQQQEADFASEAGEHRFRYDAPGGGGVGGIEDTILSNIRRLYDAQGLPMPTQI